MTIRVRATAEDPEGLTVKALRDLAEALDAAGVPDGTRLSCDHDARHLIALGVQIREDAGDA